MKCRVCKEEIKFNILDREDICFSCADKIIDEYLELHEED